MGRDYLGLAERCQRDAFEQKNKSRIIADGCLPRSCWFHNLFFPKHSGNLLLDQTFEPLLVGVGSIAPANNVVSNALQEGTAQLVSISGMVHCRVRRVVFVCYFYYCCFGATSFKFTVIIFAAGVHSNSRSDGVCLVTVFYWSIHFFVLWPPPIHDRSKYNQYRL